jgi:hypothetical protein
MRPIVLSLFAAALCGQTGGFVSLTPVKDVTEHWILEGTPPETWSVRDGVIYCTGKPNGFLRSKKVYKNYVFQAEWRFRAEGWQGAPERWPNAGFFIHAGPVSNVWPISHEVQGYFGQAGSLFGVRGGSILGAWRGPFVKERVRFGDWDRYEITSLNGRVSVVLNGKLVNEGFGAEPAQGNICVQSEGWEVHYRNLRIKELP